MALYKRANSKYWWMKFFFGGELVQQSTKCSNKRDALTVEAAFRHELALGRIGIEPRREVPTFENAVEDFLEWAKTEHKSSPTYRRYFFACTPLKKFFGKKKVDAVDKTMIEKYIAWRSDQPSRKTGVALDNATINRELLTVKKIFRRLLEAQVIRYNPGDAIKRLPEADPPYYVLNAKEEKIYLLACPPPLADVAVLILETGSRPSEVANIRRQDVFLSQDYFQVVKGKTKSARRKVFLTAKAKAVLSDRLKRFQGEFLFPFNDADGERPNTTDALDKMHAQTMEKLAFRFRLYDCRHSCASRLLEKGKVDLVTLAAILGHNSLRMVMRYAHPSENHKAEAIKRMDRTKIKGVKAV